MVQTWRSRLAAAWNILRGRPTVYRVTIGTEVRLAPLQADILFAPLSGLLVSECTFLTEQIADRAADMPIAGWPRSVQEAANA